MDDSPRPLPSIRRPAWLWIAIVAGFLVVVAAPISWRDLVPRDELTAAQDRIADLELSMERLTDELRDLRADHLAVTAERQSLLDEVADLRERTRESASPPTVTWQRSVRDRDTDYLAVAAAGPGFVAVERFRGAVVSEDGRSWVSVADQAAFETDGRLWLSDVLSAGSQIVLVGTEESPSGDARGAVWLSGDGWLWDRVSDDGGVFDGPGSQGIGTITRLGSQLVAMGSDDPPDAPRRVAVWVSEDGLRWERVPHDPAAFEADQELSVSSAAAGPNGVVVVGRRGTTSALWHSPDGRTWQLLPPQPGIFGGESNQTVTDVLAVETGFLAVGNGPAGPTMWSSTTGVTWRTVADFGPGTVQGITEVAGGFVAVGSENRSGIIRAGAWISSDGAAWQRLPHDETTFGGEGNTVMYDAAATVDTVVAVGFGGIWVGEIDRRH